MSFPLDPIFKAVEPLSKIYGKVHDSVDEWNSTASVADQISDIAEKAVDTLNRIPGITQAHSRDFKRSTPIFTLRDGSVVKTWKNPVGVNHVFIADSSGKMLFGGFVGWINTDSLQQSISKIRAEFT